MVARWGGSEGQMSDRDWSLIDVVARCVHSPHSYPVGERTGPYERSDHSMVVSVHVGWRHVLFANSSVDPSVVAPHIPDELTLDTFDGNAWLSVVPFTNVDVRPAALPTGTGFSLPELNLRTYVSHGGKRGVYFFSLDAEGVLGVLGARLLHHLPYFYARMNLGVEDGDVHFSSSRMHPGARPAHFRSVYAPDGNRLEAEPGSLAAFLTARHRYYTRAPSGTVRYAVVEHETWPLYPARVRIEENELFHANCFDHPTSEPVYFYSPGVDTVASPSQNVS